MMQLPTNSGIFTIREYVARQRGMTVKFEFRPGPGDSYAGPVGLIQVVNPSVAIRGDAQTCDGWYVDAGQSSSPIFGLREPTNGYKIENSRVPNWINFGAHGTLGMNMSEPALLYDMPGREKHGTFTHRFEVAAVWLAGQRQGECHASLQWGYSVNGDAVVPDKPMIHEQPTPSWLGAVEAWNTAAKVKVPLRR